MKGMLLLVLVASGGLLFFGCAAMHQGSAQTDYAQGRLDDAASEIQSALASDPDNLQLKHLAAKIFTARGVRSYQGGQMVAASDDFHRAIDYYPTDAQPYDYLGLIAFSQHDWRDALRYGSQAAGLAGKPDPGYVHQAREELRREQSGNPGVRRGRRPQNWSSQTQ